jgi:hypothetical protein
LEETLQISLLTNRKNPLLQVELSFFKGQLQRQLITNNPDDILSCIESFLSAIRSSSSTFHELRMLRQCYLEVSLIFHQVLAWKQSELELHATTQEMNAVPAIPESNNLQPKENKKKKGLPSSKKSKEVRAIEKDLSRLSKICWVCVRAAGVISKAQRRIELLPGDQSVTATKITKSKSDQIPAFALFDIVGTANIVKHSDSYVGDEGVVQIQGGSNVEKSWVHLLNYSSHLQRVCNYSSLALSDGSADLLLTVPGGCHRQMLKQAAVHKFLKNNLTEYDHECCPILPVELIVTVITVAIPRRPSSPTSTSRTSSRLDDELDESINVHALPTECKHCYDCLIISLYQCLPHVEVLWKMNNM